MNQGERKLENKNFNKSMLPEEQGQELVFQEENNKSISQYTSHKRKETHICG